MSIIEIMERIKDFFRKYPGLIYISIVAVLFIMGYLIYMNNYNEKKRKSMEIYDSISSNVLVISSDIQSEDNSEVEAASVDELDPRFATFLEECGEYKDVYMPLLADVHVDFDNLTSINSDIIAYLVVPDSIINYPVLYKEGEADYYLNRNIDGSKGFPGCIYVQDYNHQDFEDSLTILYGHNMLDDTMFGTLTKYNKPNWRNERPYFVIYTESAILVYKVELCSTYSDEHLLIDDFHKDEESDEWIFDGLTSLDAINARRHIKKRGSSSAYFSEEDWSEDDKIVAMSTCGNKGERYIVAGRLVFTWEYGKK